MSGRGSSSGRGIEAAAEAGNRFGLTPDDLESISGGGQVEGVAIVSLMQHYARAERTVVNHIASEPAMLSASITDLNADRDHDTFLIPLQVNATTGNYGGPGNHYTGLVVRRLPAAVPEGEAEGPPTRYNIQFIDPIGRPIESSVEEILRESMGTQGAVIEDEIISYDGGLQRARIVRESGEAKESASEIVEVFEGNDVDCGPMLVYLMTKASHIKLLPVAVGGAVDPVKASLDVGRGLRQVFLIDNANETVPLAKLEDLEPERLADIGRTIMPDRPDRGVGKGGLPRIERNSREGVPAFFRRLDSLARLTAGKEACSAVAFTGDRLLIANNFGKINGVTERVMDFLSDVARREMPIEEMAINEGFQAELDAIADFAAMEIASGKKKRRGQTTADIKVKHKVRLLRDIKKLVSSLAKDDGRTPNLFPPEVKAIFAGREYQFVPGTERSIDVQGKMKSVTVHAEMAILDRVVGREVLEVADTAVREGRKPFYVGISMLCCRDCHHAVESLNKSEHERRRVGIKEIVGVRGEHLQVFPWAAPEFFERRPEVAVRYEKRKRERVNYNSGEPMADTSASESEMDNVARRSALGGAEVGMLGGLSPGSTPLTKGWSIGRGRGGK